MGLGAHTGDAKLHERSAVQANYQDVCALIQGVWEQFIAKELLAMFNANDIVCSELKSPNDMHDDPQARANDLAHLTLENGWCVMCRRNLPGPRRRRQRCARLAPTMWPSLRPWVMHRRPLPY
ncbi:CoA transferase [Pseudoramibacter alactolyticus]|uniref:CoA transferase n=1 Tax=Pseudoramibacter alactolyticus TaxID=113287 RepID=UPI0012EAD54A